MRHARALLPYVATAAIIAAGSIALVFTTVDAGGDVAAAPSVRPGGTQELSSSGRLAYWRQSPSGAFVLWAANFDGSAARPLTTQAANTSRPSRTRWTGDGSAVAYVTDQNIVVMRLDGTRVDIPFPGQLRNSAWRLIDQRWSPSGTRIAATFQRSTDGRTDVYVGALEGRELVPAGTVGNSFAGAWLSDEELLIESDTGVLGVLREPGKSFRKLVDRSAASPYFDGSRIHFLAGLITPTFNATGLFVTNPTIWSVLPDGKGLRAEVRLEVSGALRIDGVWPDARYLMHVGVDQTQYLVGPRSTSLAPSSLLQRTFVSADRTIAIGFGGSRIVRIDLTRGLTPPQNAFVVLLDGVISADAWVRRSPVP